jgi:hypothetical protein
LPLRTGSCKCPKENKGFAELKIRHYSCRWDGQFTWPLFHMILTPEDEKDIQQRGLALSDLMQQIHQFTAETRPVRLERPCTPSDGILILSGADCHKYQRTFEQKKEQFDLLKFVPASGAASRMFKHLYNYDPDNTSDLTEEFIVHFDRFLLLQRFGR